MIHQLRVYTGKPGTIPKILEASGTVARRIREGDKYGVLEGHWSSEIGPLNQYVHLWAYDSLAEMERLRAELGKIPAWQSEYIPLIRPSILRQDVYLLRPTIDMKMPKGEGNFHELRRYRLQPGKAVEFTKRMADHLPAREKYSQNLGIWTCDFPDPNEVFHLWSYESWAQRMEARKGSQADPDWQNFLSFAGPVIEDMTSMILQPSEYSPRK